MDTRGRELHQGVLAARRRNPEPERVQNAGRPLQVGGTLAQQARGAPL